MIELRRALVGRWSLLRSVSGDVGRMSFGAWMELSVLFLSPYNLRETSLVPIHSSIYYMCVYTLQEVVT